MSQLANILIIEDEAVLAMDLVEQLVSYGYHVVGTARSGRNALLLFQTCRVDLVLCDIGLPGEWDGIQTVVELIGRRPVPIIYLTGHADSATLVRAQATHPVAFLTKPCQSGPLHRAIERALYLDSVRRLACSAPQQSDLPISLPLLTPAPPNHHLVRRDSMANETLFIRQQNCFVRVVPSEILYVEADETHSIIVTAGQRYSVPFTLATVLARFASDRLVRTHRYVVVNLDQVEAFNEWEVVVSGKALPLGGQYREAFLAHFPPY